MSDRKTPLYQIELLKFEHRKDFATVDIQKLDLGLSSEWWVSHNLGHDIRLSGSLRIPLMGLDVLDGERRAGFIAGEVMEAVSYFGAHGDAGVGGPADVRRRAHCRDHLAYQIDGLDPRMTATDRTAALYRFAIQFNVTNPAALIAQIEGLDSVRTVHDRLAYARKIGLLDSPGKGKIRA
ncbi:MAG: hypothetical protein ACRC5T_04355 [Cetobacterium sp.]